MSIYAGNITPWDHYPKHLRFNEIMDPLLVIRVFFGSGWPNDHRQDLKEWRHYVMNAKCYKHRQGPSNLLFIYEQHVRLTEAAYLLLLHHQDKWPPLEKAGEEQIVLEKKDWVYFPENLTAKELANPYSAIKKCFKKISPQVYRDHLKYWLEAALDKHAADETIRAAEIINVYHNIRKLYSATWLIHQRETDRTFTHQSWGGGGKTEQLTPNIDDELLASLKVNMPQLKGGHKMAMQKIRSLIVKRLPGVSLIYLVGKSEKPSIYFLFVIMDDSVKLPEHEIANKIEDHCRFLGRIFAFVQKLGAATEAIKQGDRFLHIILSNSLTVFSAPETALLSTQAVDDQVWAAEAEKDWNRWGAQGKAFMKGAIQYLGEHHYALALFSLHQAAESSLIGIIHAILGYRTSGHNLPRMIKLTLLFTDEIKRALELNTTEGVQLFNLLQRGYSEARYQPEFNLDEESVKLLKDKVQQLINKIEQVYHQFIKNKIVPEVPPAGSDSRRR
ncbi:HEPN domain-containing protein [Mucilaginibacter sp. Bleaf8]|nr:HEPN domain-containing protein [Mucilaginibacter sp. Bleaf8]